MNFEALLFDFDGTLLNTNDLIIETFAHVIDPKFPGRYQREDYLKFIGPTLVESFTEVDASNAEALVAEYRLWNQEHHDELVTEFPHVKEVLVALQEAGVRLAVVSTKRGDTLRKGLDLMGITELFEVIISQDEVTHTKPHPEPVEKAVALLGVEKSKTLMIGDNSHDILGGHNAGVKAAGVAWSYKGIAYLEQFNPDYILHDMTDLYDIVGIKSHA